jgi:GNAT superfamily N-acetyltransferase
MGDDLMPVHVRPATEEDHPALQAIEMAAGELFRPLGMDDIADSEPPTLDELAEAVAVWVAIDDQDRPVGYAWVELVDGHAHLEQLSVRPEHGGRGIGTQLLDAVATWAWAQGHREVTLTTYRDVAFNAPLYARRGFEVVSEAEWTDEIRQVVEEGAAHGLDPALRVVMRRRLDGSPQ